MWRPVKRLGVREELNYISLSTSWRIFYPTCWRIFYRSSVHLRPPQRSFSLHFTYSHWKKTWPFHKKKQFLRHKSYSNVTRMLCISLVMIFSCVPIIFWLFRQVHGHSFFFSLLTAFAIHNDNQKIHKWRSFFAKAKPLFKVDFNIFSW